MLVLRDPVALVDHMLNVRYGRLLFRDGRLLDQATTPKTPYPVIECNGVRYLPPVGEQYLYLLPGDPTALLRLRLSYANRCRAADRSFSAVLPSFLLSGNHVLYRREFDPALHPPPVSHYEPLPPEFDGEKEDRDVSLANWHLLTARDLLDDVMADQEDTDPNALWQFRAVIYDPYERIQAAAGSRLPDALSAAFIRFQYTCPHTGMLHSYEPLHEIQRRALPFHPQLGLSVAGQLLLAGRSPFIMSNAYTLQLLQRVLYIHDAVLSARACPRCLVPIFRFAARCEQEEEVAEATEEYCCLLCANAYASSHTLHPVESEHLLDQLAATHSGSLVPALLRDCVGEIDTERSMSTFLFPRAAGGQWRLFTSPHLEIAAPQTTDVLVPIYY